MTQFQLASSAGDYSPRCNADRVSPRHETGLKGRRKSWRGLSFVRGEFWLAAKKQPRSEKQGWNYLARLTSEHSRWTFR
jgi:hypothetical protein